MMADLEVPAEMVAQVVQVQLDLQAATETMALPAHEEHIKAHQALLAQTVVQVQMVTLVETDHQVNQVDDLLIMFCKTYIDYIPFTLIFKVTLAHKAHVVPLADQVYIINNEFQVPVLKFVSFFTNK